MYRKYRPWAQKHGRPVRPKNGPNIPQGSLQRKQSGIPRPALVELVRGLSANYEEKLPDGDRRRAKKQRGADVGEENVENGEARLPTEEPSNHSDRKYEVRVSTISVKQRNIVVRHLGSICGTNGAVGTESYKMSPVGLSDARRGEEAVVVAGGYAVSTQGTVVGTWRYRDLAVNTVLPVAARQRAVARDDTVAVTVAVPDEQEIAENLQRVQQ